MNMKSDEFNKYLNGLIYDIKMIKMQEESQAKMQKKGHYDKYIEPAANNAVSNAGSAAHAYEKIFEAIKPFVYKHGRKILGKYNSNNRFNIDSVRSDEFDIVDEWQEHLQNLYIQIYNCVNRFDLDKNVKFTFYATICIQNYFYNYATKHIRIEKREKSLDNTVMNADSNNSDKNMDKLFVDILASDDEGPEEKCIRAERSKILDCEIKKLSDKQRMLLYYYYSGKMTLTQIGELFGQPYYTVRHLRDRTLEELRRKLKGEIEGLFDFQ